MSLRGLGAVGALLGVLAFGCTVDQVVGVLATDGGSETCTGQVCTPGCGSLEECQVRNGASVGFACETYQACAPACTPSDGPCQLLCDARPDGGGEHVDCEVSCSTTTETCVASCSLGACSVTCSHPAVDGGCP